MEQKSKFSSATGFSGKLLVASLFILSGILLFARNMGWITAELFSIIVSWYSLFIIMGIYSMIRRHFVGGIILVLIGVYFLLGGLSWLPENSQAMVWPFALIIAGVLFLFKSGHRGPWNHKQRMFRDHREWMKHGHYGHAGMNFANNQQQSESEDGFLRSDNTFGAARHVVLDDIPGYPEDYFAVEDDLARASALLAKRRVPETRGFEKLVRFLMGKGFSYHIAADAVKARLDAECEECAL